MSQIFHKLVLTWKGSLSTNNLSSFFFSCLATLWLVYVHCSLLFALGCWRVKFTQASRARPTSFHHSKLHGVSTFSPQPPPLKYMPTKLFSICLPRKRHTSYLPAFQVWSLDRPHPQRDVSCSALLKAIDECLFLACVVPSAPLGAGAQDEGWGMEGVVRMEWPCPMCVCWQRKCKHSPPSCHNIIEKTFNLFWAMPEFTNIQKWGQFFTWLPTKAVAL